MAEAKIHVYQKTLPENVLNLVSFGGIYKKTMNVTGAFVTEKNTVEYGSPEYNQCRDSLANATIEKLANKLSETTPILDLDGIVMASDFKVANEKLEIYGKTLHGEMTVEAILYKARDNAEGLGILARR